MKFIHRGLYILLGAVLASAWCTADVWAHRLYRKAHPNVGFPKAAKYNWMGWGKP